MSKLRPDQIEQRSRRRRITDEERVSKNFPRRRRFVPGNFYHDSRGYLKVADVLRRAANLSWVEVALGVDTWTIEISSLIYGSPIERVSVLMKKPDLEADLLEFLLERIDPRFRPTTLKPSDLSRWWVDER